MGGFPEADVTEEEAAQLDGDGTSQEHDDGHGDGNEAPPVFDPLAGPTSPPPAEDEDDASQGHAEEAAVEPVADDSELAIDDGPPTYGKQRWMHLASKPLVLVKLREQPFMGLSDTEKEERRDKAERLAHALLLARRHDEFAEIRARLARAATGFQGDIWVIGVGKGGFGKSPDAANRACVLSHALPDIRIAWIDLDEGAKWPGLGVGMTDRTEPEPEWAGIDMEIPGFGAPTANVAEFDKAILERLDLVVPEWMEDKDRRAAVLASGNSHLHELAAAHEHLLNGPVLSPAEVAGMMKPNAWGVRCLVSYKYMNGAMARRVLTELKHHFELIIVDTGPNIRAAETIEAIKLANGLIMPLLLTSNEFAPEMVAHSLELLRGKLIKERYDTSIVDRAVINAIGVQSEFDPRRHVGGLTNAVPITAGELRKRAFQGHPGPLTLTPWSRVITQSIFSKPGQLAREEPDTYSRYLHSSLAITDPCWTMG
ncbi:MAG: hypothetical protein R3313_01810 [Candidatus Saccharimonadales bacterium]|nr:hypothetical protein [Candidatus Saccharimonadales bacterium]